MHLRRFVWFAFLMACSGSPREPQAPAPSGLDGGGTGGAATGGTNAGAAAGGTAASTPPARGTLGAMCGGIAAFPCNSGLYCSYTPDARCGAGDMSGTCEPVPEMCTEQYDPVCGCNGKQYGNACAAAREGVSVQTKGECAPASPEPTPIAEGQLCGTRGVPGECAPGLYCAYKKACGADDSGGTCRKRPEACTKIYKPVCGCDGKRYPNACTAESAGTSVSPETKCEG